MKKAINNFFLPPLPESQENKHSQEKWQSRQTSLQSNLLIGGKIRKEPEPSTVSRTQTVGYDASHGDSVDGRITLLESDSIQPPPSIKKIHPHIPQKDSILNMVFKAMFVMKDGRKEDKRSLRKPEPHSRSFMPAIISDARENDRRLGNQTPDDISFFDSTTSTSGYNPEPTQLEEDRYDKLPTPMPRDLAFDAPQTPAAGLDEPDNTVRLLSPDGESAWKFRSASVKKTGLQAEPGLQVDSALQVASEDQTDLDTDAFKETFSDVFSSWDNSERRQMGMGFIGNLCGWEYKYSAKAEDIYQHRPYFTYWVTFVQVVVFIVAVSVYGIGPVGLEEVHISGEMRTHNFAIERVTHSEIPNIWIGPRQADLIHLGAKYSPCMRADKNVMDALLADQDRERRTACCVRNDGSGCIQKGEPQCSNVLSTWHNWTKTSPGPDGRLSGSVCGQDPRYCKNPASQGAFIWEDDLTTWPVCKEGVSSQAEPHMACEVVGRPCCVGIQGECIMTTREYCDFRRGYFHAEATLCSQVSCLQQICGMIRFHNPQSPDQIYRLWISFFLHGGLVQLFFTVLFQFFVMRDMEKLAGWLRVFVVYFVSGIGGSLASAIFLPYHVEAGPSGSQFGIMAMVLAELVHTWDKLESPRTALLKLLGLLLGIFLIGLLPYIDNYAHLFGLVFGFLMSFAIMPHIDFNRFNRTGKIIGIVVCLTLVFGLFALLTVLFYVVPIYHCPGCQYFNCVPFTKNFCKNMEIVIRREHSVEL